MQYLLPFSREEQVIFVAELEDVVIGMTHLMIESDEENNLRKAYTQVSIEDLIVDEKYQKMGVGTLLTDASEKWALEHGIKTLTCITHAFNNGALSFYKSRNFIPRSIRLNKEL